MNVFMYVYVCVYIYIYVTRVSSGVPAAAYTRAEPMSDQHSALLKHARGSL